MTKIDNTNNLVLDYRRLNVKVRSNAILPRQSGILFRMNGTRYHICLDLSQSCHQLEIKNEDKHEKSRERRNRYANRNTELVELNVNDAVYY